MKSHDFGQFLFNASILNEIQLAHLISIPRNSVPTLATTALFLRLVSMSELMESMKRSQYADENFSCENLDEYLHSHDESVQEKYDVIVQDFLTPRQLMRARKFGDSRSLLLAQELVDSGVVNSAKLDRLLDEYHRLEISPVEVAFGARYNSIRDLIELDYPFVLDLLKYCLDFLSDNFNSTLILLPDSDAVITSKFGASVKIMGESSVVVGILADEDEFHKMSRRYDKFLSGTLEDNYDAISEMLNVFAGHYMIKTAENFDVEQELEPPRFGEADEDIGFIKILSDIGYFYLYIGKREIFPNSQDEV